VFLKVLIINLIDKEHDANFMGLSTFKNAEENYTSYAYNDIVPSQTLPDLKQNQ
jgi:hypothetical protein